MKFFFHTDTDSRSNDVEGMEFDAPDEAKAQAIAMCGQMMRDAPRSFWGSRPWSVTVTDEAGLILWNIDLDATSSAAGSSLEGNRP
jgi:hypothetical protein